MRSQLLFRRSAGSWLEFSPLVEAPNDKPHASSFLSRPLKGQADHSEVLRFTGSADVPYLLQQMSLELNKLVNDEHKQDQNKCMLKFLKPFKRSDLPHCSDILCSPFSRTAQL